MPPSSARTAERLIEKAMQLAWDEWVVDTGCFPDCFSIHRGPKLEADFGRGNFASHVAGWVLAHSDDLLAVLVDAGVLKADEMHVNLYSMEGLPIPGWRQRRFVSPWLPVQPEEGQ